MTITQTVEIPADHRLVIDVPREVPIGRTILIFKPIPQTKKPSIRALRGSLHQVDLSDLRDGFDRML